MSGVRIFPACLLVFFPSYLFRLFLPLLKLIASFVGFIKIVEEIVSSLMGIVVGLSYGVVSSLFNPYTRILLPLDKIKKYFKNIFTLFVPYNLFVQIT